MALDFSTYLDVDVDSIPKSVPSLPLGHYFATIKSWKGTERFYDKENPKKGTPTIELTFTLSGPDDDVDLDTLPDGKLPIRTVTRDYNLVENGQTHLRNLAEDTLGLPVKGYSLGDLLDAITGQECRVYNEPRANPKEDGQFYVNIKKVIAAS